MAENTPSAAPSRRRVVRVRDVLAVLTVVVVMFVGTFKPIPDVERLPVDVTAVAGILVALAIVAKVIADRGSTRLPVGLLLIAAAFVPGFFIGDPNPYTSRAQLGVLLSGATTLGAFWLIDTPVRRMLWLWSLVVVGVAVALLLEPDPSGFETVAGLGSTISSSQALGVAIVVILTLVLHGTLSTRPRLVVALALTAYLAVGLAGTGSRGPVAAAGVALVLSAITLRRPGRFKRSLTVGAVLASGWIALVTLTNPGAERLRLALTGAVDNTESRDGVWTAALETIPLLPEGAGWGNFWSVLEPADVLDSGYVQHAHNIVLEAFVEGGWPAGVAMIALIAGALLRLKTAAQQGPLDAAVFSVAVFFVVCAMFSGSMGNNRAMFAALAIGYAVQRSSERGRPVALPSGGDRQVDDVTPRSSAAHAFRQQHPGH